MPEVISNTSPLQYLHHLGLLDLLRKLYQRVNVPLAVVHELDRGRSLGLDLPDPANLPWMMIRRPSSGALLPLMSGLGPGEREAICLASEVADPLLLLDDAKARRYARGIGIPMSGTLGVLIKAKHAGALRSVSPFLDQLEGLNFYCDPRMRLAVLRLTDEG